MKFFNKFIIFLAILNLECAFSSTISVMSNWKFRSTDFFDHSYHFTHIYKNPPKDIGWKAPKNFSLDPKSCARIPFSLGCFAPGVCKAGITSGFLPTLKSGKLTVIFNNQGNNFYTCRITEEP